MTLGRSKIFRRAVFFQAVIWTPIAAYFVWAYPAWSWWYLIPDEKIGLGFKTLPLVVEFFTALGAFVVIRELIRAGFKSAAWGVLAVLGLILGLLMILPIPIILRVGTYAEHLKGDGTLMIWPSFFWIEMAVIGAIFWTSVGWVIRKNTLDNRDPQLWLGDRAQWPPAPNGAH